MTRDFNVGTLNAGVWTSQPFTWATIQAEGAYRIRIVAKDFTSGESTAQVAGYRLTSRVTGGGVVNPTANSLVALYSAPSCPVGGNMRVIFEKSGGTADSVHHRLETCNGATSMNF